MLKCQNYELKGRRQAPLRETLALFGQDQHPISKTLALLGLLQAATRAKWSKHTATSSRKRPACPGWRPVHQKPSSHLQWVIPPRSGSAKVSWVRTSFFFFMQGLISTLSCLCHPSNHLMGSSAPWRSELIISPCVLVHWYLSAGYGPAHQRLCPPWAHQS
jgi:hypothetical protein